MICTEPVWIMRKEVSEMSNSFEKAWNLVKEKKPHFREMEGEGCQSCGEPIHFQDEPHWSAGECRNCWNPEQEDKDESSEKHLLSQLNPERGEFDQEIADEEFLAIDPPYTEEGYDMTPAGAEGDTSLDCPECAHNMSVAEMMGMDNDLIEQFKCSRHWEME